ncbi:Lrp/AsnC family transcriptional regulator [Halomarina oriensis]|uniref:AsnC family transcriptional regulator n=1 Tax=Halomarina oriensis TaxID=671145 RepID=A0A6B0GHR8_9EURY|nr:Lrp/AsnC family transcriptional regulator [Halomarina oriensis]MWG34150.1 AsnC family transcriptional regulator [Halomarina oriensis]
MRHSAAWMSIWDDRILEYLQENGPSPVGEIAENEYIHVSQPTVSRRCQRLAEHGFTARVGNGVYVITERGKSYLAGELNAAENQPDQIPKMDSEPATEGKESGTNGT